MLSVVSVTGVTGLRDFANTSGCDLTGGVCSSRCLNVLSNGTKGGRGALSAAVVSGGTRFYLGLVTY